MELQNIKSSINKHIPELDGLRGIAILMVIFFHYFGQFTPIFNWGWMGVDLFFVLSGFLITSRLIDTVNKPKYFFRFYRNRILRIFPLYFFVLICFYLLIRFGISEASSEKFGFYLTHWPQFFLFLQNWSFMAVPQLGENQLQHFWSLAVEEQFYLFWPFAILWFHKSKNLPRILYLLLLGVILLRTVIYFRHPESYLFYFYNTFCRMDGFIIGAMVYFIWIKRLKPFPKFLILPGLAAFFITLWISNNSLHSPLIATYGLTLIAFFFGGSVYSALRTKSKFYSFILTRKWLMYIGKISFGLYIFHWIILRFLQGYLTVRILNYVDFNTKTASFIAVIFCLVISFLVSMISFRFFESYFLSLKKKQLKISKVPITPLQMK